MDTFNIVVGIFSIIGTVASIFTVSKVVTISKNINKTVSQKQVQKGKDNIQVGRDFNQK